MAVSDAGEIYIAGTSEASGNSKALTAKINTEGNIAWVKVYEGPDDTSTPTGQSIALDAAGDVYVGAI